MMKNSLVGLILLVIIAFTGCELLDETDPDSDIRDKITGEWKVAEDSERFGNSFYTTNIQKDLADSSFILIADFYGLDGFSVSAKMNDLSIDIPDQTGRGATIQDGYGSVSSNFRTITLYYYVDLQDGEARDLVKAVYTRN